MEEEAVPRMRAILFLLYKLQGKFFPVEEKIINIVLQVLCYNRKHGISNMYVFKKV